VTGGDHNGSTALRRPSRRGNGVGKTALQGYAA